MAANTAETPNGDGVDSALPPRKAVIPTLRSEELLRGRREVLIQHDHEVYRLSVTRNGKLILTK
jgi:hemin uptake protein HemP